MTMSTMPTMTDITCSVRTLRDTVLSCIPLFIAFANFCSYVLCEANKIGSENGEAYHWKRW